MVIQHNLVSIFTNRQLGINTNTKNASIKKLSTGYQINSAADDAAGLQISERMRTQIRGLGKAQSNIQDGISMVQTADGALGEVHSVLQRMNEISVQASNATYTDEDRDALSKEYSSLRKEINRIGKDTEFNTQKLLFDDTLSVAGMPSDVQEYCSAPGVYAGILYDGTRYDFSQVKTADGTHTMAENPSVAGTYYLTTQNGTQLKFGIDEGKTVPDISKAYNLFADTSGIEIDDRHYDWADVCADEGGARITEGIQEGFYTLNDLGSEIQFYAEDGDTMDDMIAKVNASHVHSNDWESKLSYSLYENAVDHVTEKPSSITVTSANASKMNPGNHTIHADTNGISLDGNSSVAWSDLTFTPAYYGSTQGVDFSSGKGIGDLTTVSYTCPDTGIGFQFNINDCSSMQEAIAGLNNISFSTSVSAGLSSSFNLDTSSSDAVMSGASVVGTSISYLSQRDAVGLQFDGNAGPPVTAGTAATSSAMSSFTVSFNGGSGADYAMTSDSMNNLKDFFENGISSSVNLQFEDANNESISIDFSKTDNTTDGTRPKLADFGGDMVTFGSAMDTYVNNLVTKFQSQFSTSSMSLQSTGATMSIGTMDQNSMVDGNKVLVPKFGVKPQVDESIYKIKADVIKDSSIDVSIGKVSSLKLGLANKDVSTYQKAQENMKAVQDAITMVSAVRSKLGAYENRLESAMTGAANQQENQQKAESRIRDVDMANEMVKYSRSQLLEQASQTVLSQANQSQEGILKLLS